MAATLDQAVTDMLSELESRLPAPVPAVPPHNVTAVRIRERLAGLGRLRGTERRGLLGPVVLKAHRLEGEVRFQLWTDASDTVDAAVLDLQRDLLQASEALRAAGFLRFAATDTTLAEAVPTLSAWRKTASFEVLYESTFEDSDATESLIARVPITSDLERPGSPGHETRIETDAMVRWDDEGASPLVVRGPRRLGSLAALAFLPPGPPPAGGVTLTRTFDGAAGPPVALPTVAAFLAAVGGPDPAELHARLSFGSIPAFLAALTPAGGPLELGDWNLDTITDVYEPLSLSLEPTLVLLSAGDRFEVRHANPALGAPAVVYLRLS
jgi:hypothetical protein